jgi:hypothetical protein
MSSHFPPAGHSHPAAVHFHQQAGTFQLEVHGPPSQAAGFQSAGFLRLAPVAHISLDYFFRFFHCDISPLVS